MKELRARGARKVRSVKIDEDNLVLPKLRYGTAGVEDEMLQLSQGDAQLVASGCGRGRGFAGTVHNT
ncbi:MAG TPA: hypothetical protein VEM96_11655 [Pyrinomonadaceae bacterium]|nr:hypothetical protein [Pyrinomonadaceae bacterium]